MKTNTNTSFNWSYIRIKFSLFVQNLLYMMILFTAWINLQRINFNLYYCSKSNFCFLFYTQKNAVFAYNVSRTNEFDLHQLLFEFNYGEHYLTYYLFILFLYVLVVGDPMTFSRSPSVISTITMRFSRKFSS